MKISNMQVLITKVEAKANKEGASYISLSFLDLSSGDNFNVISKDLEYLKLKPMTKYSVSLNLSSSKYGLKLEIANVSEDLGSI